MQRNQSMVNHKKGFLMKIGKDESIQITYDGQLTRDQLHEQFCLRLGV